MTLALLWQFVRIISLIHGRLWTLRNSTMFGGLPWDQSGCRIQFFGGHGFWPSDDDHDFGGGGGGGKWQFDASAFFSRPHPIELFDYTEDKLVTSLKTLNERQYTEAEWLNIYNMHPEEILIDEMTMTHCNCPGACNCMTFSLPADDTKFVDVQIWLPESGHSIQKQRMCWMKIRGSCSNEYWYWIKIFQAQFGIDLKDFILMINYHQFSPSVKVEPGSVIEIIPKGCGGMRSNTKVLQFSNSNVCSGDDSDPDRREIIDMPVKWEITSSGDDDDKIQEEVSFFKEKQENAVNFLQKFHKENEITEYPSVSMESSEEEDEVNMQELRRKRKVRRHRALTRHVVAMSLSTGCCKNDCLSNLCTDEILQWRKSQFWCLNEEQQRQFLLNAFALNVYYDGAKRKYSFEINGKRVCQKGWYKSLGISSGWFYGLLKEFLEEGRTSGESMRRGSKWMSEKMRRAIVWLQRHIECSGDFMPHENRVCLPSCQSKTEIFAIYKEDLAQSHLETISWSAFKKMWREYFGNVIIPKQNKFTKCGICTLIKYSMGKTRDYDKRCNLAVKKKVHLTQQSAERNHYYENRLKAEMEPQKYLSIILDGMDQAKTNLPHVTSISKSEASHYLKTHITGAISHGDKRLFGYLDLLRWKHDSNLTLNVLLHILVKLSKDGRLPPYLLLQMDNCYRECKNKYIMAFAAYLVEQEIFKEVHVSFLMVGHTHEDVDQFFSRIAVHLKRKDVMTVPELHDAVHHSYTPKPETDDIDYMFDISTWLKSHIVTIKNHVYPHAFKFFLGSDGKAKMLYKNWATDKVWQPEGDPITILESSPRGVPDLLPPGLGGKEPTPINDLVTKLKTSSHRMTTQQLDWWTEFIKNEKELRQKWKSMTTEEKKEIAEKKWLMKHLKKYEHQRDSKEESEEDTRQKNELDRLLAKEDNFRPIEVRTKRKKGKENKPIKKAKVVVIKPSARKIKKREAGTRKLTLPKQSKTGK